MADEEVWKKIPGRKGYEASNLGRIRSVDRWITYSTGHRHFCRGKVLRQFTLWNGYKTTHLGSQRLNEYIHRLVARTFLGKPASGMDVCHVDGNKANNQLANLRYGSRSSNMADAIRHRYEQAWYEYAQNTKQHIRPRRLGS